MTLTDTGVKPLPVYTPPADGNPRNAVDAKWMKLHRAILNRSARATKKADQVENSDRH